MSVDNPQNVATLDQETAGDNSNSVPDGDAAQNSAGSQATLDSGDADSATDTGLFSADKRDGFQRQWQQVQTGFVDDPRSAVAQANDLVAAVIRNITETFDQTRSDLESQWESGQNVSTEDLRQALQQYRSFFGRLLQL